jgi:hypothetical protein
MMSTMTNDALRAAVEEAIEAGATTYQAIGDHLNRAGIKGARCVVVQLPGRGGRQEAGRTVHEPGADRPDAERDVARRHRGGH